MKDETNIPAEKATAPQTAEKPAPAPKAKAAPKPKMTPAQRATVLIAAIREIEERNTDQHRALLLKEIALEGAKLADRGGTYLLDWHGIKCSNTAGYGPALKVWAQKARRAVLELGSA